MVNEITEPKLISLCIRRRKKFRNSAVNYLKFLLKTGELQKLQYEAVLAGTAHAPCLSSVQLGAEYFKSNWSVPLEQNQE